MAAAVGTRAWDRATRHRRGRLGDEGTINRPWFADAFRRCEFRAITGCHLRRLPGEGGPHLCVVEAPRYPVRGGVGRRAGRAEGGVVLRGPAFGRTDAR